MTLPRRAACSSRRLGAAAIAVLCALILMPEAHAQAGDDLLRVIKPWIKRQLLGGESGKPETPVAEDSAAQAPGAEGAEAGPETAEAPAAADEVEPQGETAETPADAPGTENAAADDAASDAQPDGAAAASEPEAPASLEDIVTKALGEPVDAAEPSIEEPAEAGPPPLRFAVLAGRSAITTMAALGPVADSISAMIGQPVEFVAMPSYGAMIDAQAALRVDGGFFSSSAYALAESRCHCLEPIVAPRASDGTLAYHAVIVARADSGIGSAFDLKGKTVAVGAADSLGARRMQLAGLMASGIDPATAFAGAVEVASAVDAVRLVRDGRADAAFAWSSLSGDAANGYSRGTLTQLVARGELAMRDLVIVWRSAPVMHGPFAVLKSLGEKEKDEMGAFFLGLEGANPAAYDILNPFYAGGYAPVDAADYGGLETLTAQNLDEVHLPKGVLRSVAPEVAPGVEPARN